MNNLEPFDHKVDGSIRPLPDRVLVHNMEYGDTVTRNGLILLSDDGKERGIRPRWATVYAVGTNVTELKPGDRVLVSHGRWSRGVRVPTQDGYSVVRMVETSSIFGVIED